MSRLSLSSLSLCIVATFITACSTNDQPSPLINAEPPVDSIQTRAPRGLRLYFHQLPDVPSSTVTLIGPAGELNLRGLHTMGANDLMMEINDEVVSGDYTVRWQTAFGEESASYSGSYTFTVQGD